MSMKLIKLHEQVEQSLFSQQKTEHNNAQLEAERVSLNKHLKQLNPIVENERQLRNLFEEKLKETASKVFRLEMCLQSEVFARQSAEEKTRRTIEHASKTIRQALESV